MNVCQLLEIVARKLGHDMVMLKSVSAYSATGECCHHAVFMDYGTYCTRLLLADGMEVSIRCLDGNGNEKTSVGMYEELVQRLYKTLDNSGHVSDGKQSLDASMVPDFMIGCVLSGYA